MSESSSSIRQCPKCGALLPVDEPNTLCPVCLMAEAMRPTRTGDQAAPIPTLAPEELAPHFPQLEIIECLGRGGMGVVYKARQKSLNRLVALKLLAPERVDDAGFAERFQKEAHALAALNHPHIVTVYDFGAVDAASLPQGDVSGSAPAAHSRIYFLLMEFVDGVNLRVAMKAGRFTPEQALAVVPPICEALQYAHEHGIVHRDIKPENLLLDKAGRVKIADFGVAKMLGMEASGAGVAESQPAGTPQYMAPEQRGDAPRVDHRADIYSLGVVLYEMLTGELPSGKLRAPSMKVQIDVRLDEIVLRALNENPDLRYRTAAEFKTDLETFASGAPVKGAPAATLSQKAPPASAAVSPWPRFIFWLLAVIVTLPVGLLVIAVLLPVLTQRGIGAGESAIVVGFIVLIGMAMIGAVIGLMRTISRSDSASPWPRFIFWLLAVIVTLPVGLVAVAVLVPVLTQRGIGAGESAIVVGFIVLCGFIMITAVVGLMRAVSRNAPDSGHSWPRRFLWPCAGFIGVGGMIVALLAMYYRITYASPAPAHQKSISLAQAVNDFNKRRHDAAEAAGQPDLTVEAVLAAIRWAMLDRPRLGVTNATFATLGRIIETQALPKGFELELLSSYTPNDQTTFDVWSVRLRIPGMVALHGTSGIMIHEEQLNSHVIGEEERKVIRAWQEKDRAQEGVGSMEGAERGDEYRRERAAAAAIDARNKPATAAELAPAPDDSISLAQAVNDFNKRYHNEAEAANQPDLTVEAVLAAIRWAMVDRPKLSVTNATFATLGRIIETQALPKGFELELLTGYEPNDQATFTVWSVRLRIPGTVIPGGTTRIMIHEQQISSHVIGKEERKVIHAWQETERAQGGVGSMARAEWQEKYLRERAAAAADDAHNKPDLK